MPEVDLDPVQLADRTYDFYRAYDLDFVKVMSNGMYSIEDFGCVIDTSEVVQGGVARLVQGPIAKVEDWDHIYPVDVNRGALRRELCCLERLLYKMDGHAPVVATVFSPLTIADKLSGGLLREHLKGEDAAPVGRALEALSETMARFTERIMAIGADGIFFATQLATRNLLSEEQYRAYGVPWDLKVLEAAAGGWFNILHVHGENILFSVLRDYPVHCINWHIWETAPDLTQARVETDKCLMGGMVRGHITDRVLPAITEDIRRTRGQMEGYGYILAPGCGIRHPVDPQTLDYVGRSIRGGIGE